MGQIAQQDKIIFTNKTGSFEPPFSPELWGGKYSLQNKRPH